MIRTEQLTIKVANKTICRNLNLMIKPGKILGILGANGCGKTTLLHTLAGLQQPITGKVYLNEQPLAALSRKMIAQQLGILFQEILMQFPQTVKEYCLHSRYPHLPAFARRTSADEKIVLQALTLMALEKKLSQKIHTLSGGEKRRLAIAALLAQTPQIFLLDEPTNHLDFYYQQKVLTHFKYLAEAKSMSVVMALHDLSLAKKYCDDVLLMCSTEMRYGRSQALLTEENIMDLYKPFY